MNEKKQKIVYNVLNVVFALLALAGTVFLFWYALDVLGACGGEGCTKFTSEIIGSFSAALLVFIAFPLNVVLHECGHLLFGAIAGLKPAYVQIGNVIFQGKKVRFALHRRADGASAMYAKSPEGLRARLICAALGGAILNFIYGILFLALGIAFPSPAMLFFALFAPLNLYEGLLALLPAKLQAGATDGAIVQGLTKRWPFAEVMLAVMRVQAALYTKTYPQIPREWLFSLPVVREDEPAFIALLQLRWQWQFSNGEEEEALKTLERLDGLFDYASNASLACDLAYANVIFFTEPEKAFSYFRAAGSEKGTAAYARAALACGECEPSEAIAVAERENFCGLKDLEIRLIERIPHMI